jgi:MFS family permease
MDRSEFRAVSSLAAVFAVRLLGLFMIYPVFASYAKQLSGATSSKIGLALGIYGLSQGLLQIPFGMLSDKIGRKILITSGLALFGVGSVVAALSTSIDGVIWGRLLQGSGAAGSVILALVADLTSEQNRTGAMALVGVTIGLSFVMALILGPIVASFSGVQGIFWLMVMLAALGIAITQFVVPEPRSLSFHRDAETAPAMLASVLMNPELVRLDFGAFAQSAMLTAGFLVIPDLLHTALNVTTHDQWMVYLPVLAVSLMATVPAIIAAEKYRLMKTVFVGSVATLAASQLLLALAWQSRAALILSLTLFFAAYNVMAATLPSLITKTAPPDAKGTASGVYSSAQFLGIFAGGMAGGWAHEAWGDAGVFAVTTALGMIWLAAAATMAPPSHLITRLMRVSDAKAAEAESLAARLRQVRGVAEAVVVAEERIAYLKVDAKVFDSAMAESLADAR